MQLCTNFALVTMYLGIYNVIAGAYMYMQLREVFYTEVGFYTEIIFHHPKGDNEGYMSSNIEGASFTFTCR